MVHKSVLGLQYIHEHSSEPDFFTKTMHQLANQFLSVIMHLNCFPGRCGGWKLTGRVDMTAQLVGNHKNVFMFRKRKTKKKFGPLKKWLPTGVMHALKLYAELPLRDCPCFWTPHTDTKKVIVTHILQCASETLGHTGAVPNTTFVRKLFGTLDAAGEDASAASYEEAIKDLALIDAHSAKMAVSAHYKLAIA